MLSGFGHVSTDTLHQRRRAIRRLLLIAVLMATAPNAYAQRFPYTAHVNSPDVYLRSGPGENYYPVGKLDRGEAVEVYRHDPGGWCAIRPPEGSFSWVSAEFIELRQGNVGVVIGERVAARVGSAFSETRDVIQVRFNRGEEVEILEAHEIDAGSEAQTWYKISPPAGEFRWISGRHLEPELKPDVRQRSAEIASADTRPRPAVDDGADEASRLSEREDDGGSDGHDSANDWKQRGASEGVRQAVHEELPRPERRPASARAKPRSKRDDERDNNAGADDDPAPDETPPARLKPDQRKIKANLKEEAEDLDLALSAMVVAQPAEWDFTVLRKQTENALDRANTALDRGRLRRVLRKIDNFADIQQRHLACMDSRHGETAPETAANARKPFSGLLPLRYDGMGRLTQLTSLDPRVPQFALLDARGQVAAYVSPAPGVNLRRYLNQEVGINGVIGYLPERQAQHLTAKRIVPVDAGALR